VGRGQTLALDFYALANFQRHLGLVESKSDDLVRVVDEVEDSLPIQCQEGGDLGIFVVAAGILLQDLLVEQVVDEDVAVLVGDE